MSFLPSPPGLSALPLASLTVVVFDTETTGLDTTRDRVIEIGAVRLAAGRIDDSDSNCHLIDPGEPIPPASTAIHGITDGEVAGAPGFVAGMRSFAEWAGPAVFLGHSVGFDLAILEAEHRRHGLSWQAPRTLDTRDLAQAVGSDLPDWSLETLAGWLGVPVEGRHRALADAVLTARIFLALLPKLRGRGVSTLAEAERICRRSCERSQAAGLGVREIPSSAPAEYARIDSFPYRHRVAELMTAPPVFAVRDLPLADALARMIDERVGSLIVTPEAEEPYGIITERDVLRALRRGGAQVLADPVGDVCSSSLRTVGHSELVYRALVSMKTGGFRHLGVVDADGTVVGVLSARDLLRGRADDSVSLGHEIESANDAPELGRVWSELAGVARALVDEEVDARLVAAVISRELRALTRRACEIAESEHAATEAPPYAMLVLGSGGRGESLLAMDQDNAIVFREGSPGSDADRWCEALGRRVADILDQAGVRYCTGGIMASNAAWRHDLDGWRATVEIWLARTRPEDILNADIFFDAAPVHGDDSLAEALGAEARTMARASRPFLRLLAGNAAQFAKPHGWFGRLRLKEGRIDLKMAGLMPVFSAARVLAISNGIAARSTEARLRAAAEAGSVPEDLVGDLIAAHEILLRVVLRQQLRDLEAGIPLSNLVAPRQCGEVERRELDWALRQVPKVVDLVGVPAPV